MVALTEIPELHDKIIVSTAKYLKVSIITKDEVHQNLPKVKTIWQKKERGQITFVKLKDLTPFLHQPKIINVIPSTAIRFFILHSLNSFKRNPTVPRFIAYIGKSLSMCWCKV